MSHSGWVWATTTARDSWTSLSRINSDIGEYAWPLAHWASRRQIPPISWWQDFHHDVDEKEPAFLSSCCVWDPDPMLGEKNQSSVGPVGKCSSPADAYHQQNTINLFARYGIICFTWSMALRPPQSRIQNPQKPWWGVQNHFCTRQKPKTQCACWWCFNIVCVDHVNNGFIPNWGYTLNSHFKLYNDNLWKREDTRGFSTRFHGISMGFPNHAWPQLCPVDSATGDRWITNASIQINSV